MITEKELNKAITECLSEPITGTKRNILADLIIIQNYLFGEPNQIVESYPNFENDYSYTHSKQTETIIETNSGSEFLEAINGKESSKIWKLINELVEAVKILHPRMYDSVIEKIKDL